MSVSHKTLSSICQAPKFLHLILLTAENEHYNYLHFINCKTGTEESSHQFTGITQRSSVPDLWYTMLSLVLSTFKTWYPEDIMIGNEQFPKQAFAKRKRQLE